MAEVSYILAFGAHPDDIEFGCGGVIAAESLAGRASHFVVCSHGESSTNGTPDQRAREAQAGAVLLRATLEFLKLDGDAHLQASPQHALTIAAIIRRVRPKILLAPTLMPNQHPDHWRLGELVRDAARLARYGGVDELRSVPPHAIDALFYYALAPDAEPRDVAPVLLDVSTAAIMATWRAAMEAHASQMMTRDYVELQLSRARINGLRAGVEHAIALFPNDPLVVTSLSAVARGARAF